MLAEARDYLPEALDAARDELRCRRLPYESIDASVALTADERDEADKLVPDGADLKTLTTIGIFGGIVLNVFGFALSSPSDLNLAFLSIMAKIAGAIMFIWGCSNYALGKGYSRGWGAVAGLLSCLGLIILVLLPDRRKEYDDHTS